MNKPGPSDVARVCHEANRAYCHTIGDNSQPSWDATPRWQKDSAEHGVLAIIEGTVTKPEDSHVSWLAEKEANGWKWGPVKMIDLKEHPCFVEYSMLPPEQQMKDHIFFAIAKAMLGL